MRGCWQLKEREFGAKAADSPEGGTLRYRLLNEEGTFPWLPSRIPRVAHTSRRFLSGCMRPSVMRHGTVSLAKTEASLHNRMNKAVRSSSFCMIRDGFTSGLGPTSA